MNITQDQANTMRQLAETVRVLSADVGFPKEDAVRAVLAGDFGRLTEPTHQAAK